MIFSFLILLFSSSLYANFEYEGKLHGTTRTLDKYDDWVGGEINFKAKYQFNIQKDDFGLLLSDPDEIIVDTDFFYNANAPEEDEITAVRPHRIGLLKNFGKTHSLFIGDAIVIWGKADKINPLDVWNSENYDFFLTRDKDYRKIARTMLIHQWKKENQKLETIIALNDSRSFHHFPNQSAPWCNSHCNLFSKKNLKEAVALLGLDTKFNTAKTNLMDIGTRYSNTYKTIDYSIMFYHGADRFPYYTREIYESSRMEFTPYQESQNSWGLDLSTSLASFTFFFEGKYQFNRPYFLKPNVNYIISDDDGLIFRDETSWILGIDRQLPYEIYANLQLFQRTIVDRPDGLYDFGGRELYTFNLSKTFDEKYKLSYLLIMDASYGDLSEKIELEYQHSDELLARAGANFIYAQNEKSLFAGLDANDLFYVDLIYSF